MPDVILKLKPAQMEEMIKSLDDEEKLRILKQLEDALWGYRLRTLIGSLRKKARGKLSMREITKEVEIVRKQMHESRR